MAMLRPRWASGLLVSCGAAHGGGEPFGFDAAAVHLGARELSGCARGPLGRLPVWLMRGDRVDFGLLGVPASVPHEIRSHFGGAVGGQRVEPLGAEAAVGVAADDQ